MSYLENLFGLKGRRIVITGAGGLLGTEFAEALGKAGAELVLIDKDKDALETCGAKLKAIGRSPDLFVCDLTDQENVDSIINKVSQYGSIDGLINSAAINPKAESEDLNVDNFGWFSNYPLESWCSSLDINLTGVFIISQAVCRVMESQQPQKGVIVNLCSTYGLVGPDQSIYQDGEKTQSFYKPVDYSVTKAGILGFTRALAAMYKGTEIRVNALTPGGVFNRHTPAFSEKYSDRTILGRMANPTEYGGAIVFLCSDASSYMTGSNLIIDGGWTAL